MLMISSFQSPSGIIAHGTEKDNIGYVQRHVISVQTAGSVRVSIQTVAARGHAGILFENAVEKILVPVSALLCDLLDGEFRPPEQILRAGDPPQGDVLFRRNTETSAEKRGKIGLDFFHKRFCLLFIFSLNRIVNFEFRLCAARTDTHKTSAFKFIVNRVYFRRIKVGNLSVRIRSLSRLC